MTDNIIITIGRQFGSGGRLIGQAIARELGFEYYDKELLVEAARHAGMSPEFFEKRDEKAPSFLGGIVSFNVGYSSYSLYPGSSGISDEAIQRAQADCIRSIADRSSCVIVGRSADYILRDRPGVVNLFIHAPIEHRANRILERGDASTIDEAKTIAIKNDKLRSSFYNFYTDKRWGDAAGYHLTLDSSRLTTDEIVALVKQYVSMIQNK